MNTPAFSGPDSLAAATSGPWRRRLMLAVLLIGGALLIERAVSMLTEAEPEPAAEVRPRGERPPRAAAERSAAEATAAGTSTTLANAPVLQLDRLRVREQTSTAQADAPGALAAERALFAAVNAPPPPAASAPATAPVPVAPPFPYSHLGGLLDETGRTLYFGRGDRLITVRAGDTIDGVYRVDRLGDQAMQLHYLPLNQPMTIPLGDAR